MRSCSGATAVRPESSSTSRTAWRACSLRPSATTVRARQSRHRRGDLDPGDGRARRRDRRLRGRDRLGRLDAERAAAAAARRLARRAAVRLQSGHAPARGARADGRLVPLGRPPWSSLAASRRRAAHFATRPTRWSTTAESSSRRSWWRRSARRGAGALDRAQRLALLPGRRSDLARHDGLALHARRDAVGDHQPRLAARARAHHRVDGAGHGRGDPAHDGTQRAGTRAARDLGGLRARRPNRRGRRRPVVCRAVGGRAVRCDPTLRRSLPRALRRAVPPAGARPDSARRLPIDGAASAFGGAAGAQPRPGGCTRRSPPACSPVTRGPSSRRTTSSSPVRAPRSSLRGGGARRSASGSRLHRRRSPS